MDKLSKQIEHEIMLAIIRSEFAVGSALPTEDELSAHYNVSRVVIREAKRSLQVLGMVKSRKRAGSYVMPKAQWNFFNSELFTCYLEESDDALRQLENYYALRLLLEPELVVIVCRARSSVFMRSLKELFHTMARAHAIDDTATLFQADLDFHLCLYEASDNILLMPLAQLMLPLFLQGFHYSHSAWEKGLEEHRLLLDAVCSGNEAQARMQSSLLIENARERFRQHSHKHPLNLRKLAAEAEHRS